jgi:CRP-like cAMP-binding protein
MTLLDLHRFDHLGETEVVRRIGELLATAIRRHGCLSRDRDKIRFEGVTEPANATDPAMLVSDPVAQQMVQYLVRVGPASPRDVGVALGLARRTVARKLARLRATGLCEVVGKTKAARYQLRTDFGAN